MAKGIPATPRMKAASRRNILKAQVSRIGVRGRRRIRGRRARP